jgi:hypothetical protein
MRRALACLLLALVSVSCSKDSPTAPTPAPAAPPPTLQSVALSASLGSLTRVGATAQVTATGTFSNATTQDVTSLCTSWQSSNTVVLTIGAGGLMTAQGSGTANVTGTCSSVGARGTVTLTLTGTPTPTPSISTITGHVTDGTSGGVACFALGS